MSGQTEKELLEAAREGDGQALEQLLARHEKPIYRFGLRMCGSEEDARDVLQETLLTAFRGLASFRGDSQLSTWLYQLARSHCLRLRRRRVGAPRDLVSLDSPEASDVTASESGPEEAAHAREMGEVLQAAILVLPEDAREALLLRDVEGLSAEEAAAVTGIEVGALKSRLHRARLQLRKNLVTLLGEGAAKSSQGCPELAQELMEYAAHDIDQATCLHIEQHLASCGRCTQACESLKSTVSLCRRIPGDQVPAPVRAAVRRALAEQLPPRD